MSRYPVGNGTVPVAIPTSVRYIGESVPGVTVVQYFYVVVAYTSDNTQIASSPMNISAYGPYVLDGDHAILISWSTVLGAAYYLIFKNQGSNPVVGSPDNLFYKAGFSEVAILDVGYPEATRNSFLNPGLGPRVIGAGVGSINGIAGDVTLVGGPNIIIEPMQPDGQSITIRAYPAGQNTQIQFNNGGVFGASPQLIWGANQLGVAGSININSRDLNNPSNPASYPTGFMVDGTTILGINTNGTVQLSNLETVQVNGAYFVGTAPFAIAGPSNNVDLINIGTINGSPVGGGASAPNQSIQFNDNGAFGGSVNLTWDNSANNFTTANYSNVGDPDLTFGNPAPVLHRLYNTDLVIGAEYSPGVPGCVWVQSRGYDNNGAPLAINPKGGGVLVGVIRSFNFSTQFIVMGPVSPPTQVFTDPRIADFRSNTWNSLNITFNGTAYSLQAVYDNTYDVSTHLLPLCLNPLGGNVGIGSLTAPGYALDVQGDINIIDPGSANGYTFRINGVPITTGGGGATSPSGPNGAIQYNNAGAFGGSNSLLWNSATNTLSSGSGTINLTNIGTINGAPPGGSGSQTPWVQNVDAAGFNLNGVPSIGGYQGALSISSGSDNVALNASFLNLNINNSVRISLNGGVSIKLPNPQYTLDVAGDINITDPGGASGYAFRINGVPLSTGGGTPAGPNQSIQFNNSGAFGGNGNFVFNTANTTLALGAAAPGSGDGVNPFTLDVVGISNSYVARFTNPGFYTAIAIDHAQDTSGESVISFRTAGNENALIVYDSDESSLSLWSGNSSALTNTLCCAFNGFVGIQNSTPAYTLDVNGDCNLAAGHVYRIGGVSISTGGGGFWVGGSGGAIYYNGGNVGIGTSAPQANLDVNGFIRSTALGNAPTSGIGVELYINGGAGNLTAYNRGAPGLYPLLIQGSQINLGQATCIGLNSVASVPLTTLQVCGDVYRQLYLTGASSQLNQLRMGFDVSNNTCVIEGWMNGNSDRPLLLNPSGTGNVGIRFGNAYAALTVLPAFGNNPPSLTAQSLAVASFGRQSVTELSIFCEDTGTISLQTRHNTASGNAYPLDLNPLGGQVNVGSSSASNTELDISTTGLPYMLRFDNYTAGRSYGIVIDGNSAFGIDDISAGARRITINSNGIIGVSGSFVVPSGYLNVGNSIAASAGDLGVGRGGASGFIYFGNAGPYFGYDGSNWTMQGGSLYVSGNIYVAGSPLSGGITTWANYGGGGRVVGGTYQNTTGKPVFVSVTLGLAAATAYCDSGNPPGNVVASGGGANLNFPLNFWVLPGFFYKVEGTTPIYCWVEWW